MRQWLCFAALSVALSACSSAPEGPPSIVEPLPAPAEGEGFQLKFSAVAPAHTEIWKCWVIDKLPYDESFAHIQRAESRQNENMHHMDLMSLLFTNTRFEPGEYDCQDLYDQHTEPLMEDGLILYASQNAEDEAVLPDGVVAQVPTRAPWMFELHYVNYGDKPVRVESYVNAHTIPEADVTSTIWGQPVRDVDINVPAGAEQHVEWTRCEMTDPVDVLFLSSHTHELATNFEIRTFDGESVGDLVYENDDWQQPILKNFDPPLHVAAGEGFEFQCHYESNRDTETNWGLTASDEMCQMALVYTPGDPSVRCEQVESSDGALNNPD